MPDHDVPPVFTRKEKAANKKAMDLFRRTSVENRIANGTLNPKDSFEPMTVSELTKRIRERQADESTEEPFIVECSGIGKPLESDKETEILREQNAELVAKLSTAIWLLGRYVANESNWDELSVEAEEFVDGIRVILGKVGTR
jgi:hypothetical protein